MLTIENLSIPFVVVATPMHYMTLLLPTASNHYCLASKDTLFVSWNFRVDDQTSSSVVTKGPYLWIRVFCVDCRVSENVPRPVSFVYFPYTSSVIGKVLLTGWQRWRQCSFCTRHNSIALWRWNTQRWRVYLLAFPASTQLRSIKVAIGFSIRMVALHLRSTADVIWAS